MLRGLYISLNVYFLSVSAQYVCSLSEFRRSIAKLREDVELVYTNIVQTCAQMSDSLTFASEHPELFPGTLLQASQLVPCTQAPDQLRLPPHELIGVHTLNKTDYGVAWDQEALDDELQFLRPIFHLLPTLLARNPNSQAILFIGHAMECASVYTYPPRDYCGLIPSGINLCTFYSNRYNLYTKLDELQKDFDQGGHWSEPLTNTIGTSQNSYSIPVPDANGEFRVQVTMGVYMMASQSIFDQKKPSEHGYSLLLSSEGHVIYAEQKAIDVLFGAAAQLTLAKITSSYTGNQVRVVGMSLTKSATAFSGLPAMLQEREEGNSIINVSSELNVNSAKEAYYVSWARFEQTMRTWYLVGIIPTDELDYAAEWTVSPQWVNLTLSDQIQEANVTFVVENTGYLPFSFYVGLSPTFRGFQIATNDTRYTMRSGQKQTLELAVKVGDLVAPTVRFLTPFYALPNGYGQCFRPLFVDLTVNYAHTPVVESNTYAVIIVCAVCGFTALLVFLAVGMLYRYRHSPPVLAIAPRICMFKLFGLLCLLGASVCNIVSPERIFCEISRWLFNVGFSLVGCATVVKNYRLRRIFYSKKLHIVPLANMKLVGFIVMMVLVDMVLLAVGTSVQPYVIVGDSCQPLGWTVYVLLIVTKVLVWIAAFINTASLSRVPMAFADSRLNGVLVIVSILASVYLGLQFTDVMSGTPKQLLFIGSMFTWLGAFVTVCHMLLKLRSGFVVVVRPRTRTTSVSLTPPSSQNRLRFRLGALLEEMENKNARLISDKINSIENLQANQRLLFELRATLLTFETQDVIGEYSFDEEALERYLPESIRAAFDKNERAVNRRIEGERPKRSTSTEPAIVERKPVATCEPVAKPSSPRSKTRRLIVPEIDPDIQGPDSISPARGDVSQTEDEAQSLLNIALGTNHTD